jgi:hypothetical protein
MADNNNSQKGCGKMHYVQGTNGGKMPCGALLVSFGGVAPHFCDCCKRRLRKKVEGKGKQ